AKGGSSRHAGMRRPMRSWRVRFEGLLTGPVEAGPLRRHDGVYDLAAFGQEASMHAPLAVLSLLLACRGPAVPQPPALHGVWNLSPKLSQDVAEKIKLAAGSASMSGGVSWATETWIPWTGGFSEGQRVEMREFLLATVPALQSVEIEQDEQEIKTVHGE